MIPTRCLEWYNKVTRLTGGQGWIRDEVNGEKKVVLMNERGIVEGILK